MIVTRSGEKGGFVLSDHNGRFAFGPSGSPTKQMKSGLQHLLYGGNYIPPNNWLKKILLLHDAPRCDGRLLNEDATQAFLAHETPNINQTEAFKHAVQDHNTTNLGNGMRIVQGPPGTGKTSLSVLIMRFYLSQARKVMFTAGSNKAIDVAADRLLDQLIAKNEHTQGIYRIKIDALERITADPDMREREEDDEWTVGGERLSLAPEGTLRSPSLTSHNPVDMTIQASLELYLEKQLAGSPIDAFSLPRHILSRYREIANRPRLFRSRNRNEQEEHTLMLQLIAARKRCKESDPRDVSVDDIGSPISILKSAR